MRMAIVLAARPGRLLGILNTRRVAPPAACALLLSAELLVGVPSAAAQDASTPLTHYLTQVWQTEDGLPRNAVQAITQTRDGYFWLGTPEGLVRFDGVRFTVFNQFASNNVHALLEDRSGTLWVGTYGAGLYRYQQGQFIRFDTSAGLESNLYARCMRRVTGRCGSGPMEAAPVSGRTVGFAPCGPETD